MPNPLSPKSREVLTLLGQQIRIGRTHRGWTQAGLGERLGVTRLTVIAIERGAPSVAVGTVIEAAVLTGVLDGTGEEAFARDKALVRAELSLLPQAVRTKKVDDDF